MTLSKCLIGMTKNSSFLCLWPCLWAIAHCFGVMGGFTWPRVFGVIYKAHDTQYMFGRHDRKLVVFAFMDVFMSYCPLFWGSRVI
jgi:hypothetical protein